MPTQTRMTLAASLLAGAALLAAGPTRTPVLDQIALPHSYYYRELYLPQLTSGPSSVTWSADARSVIYSMQGTLWQQRIDSPIAEQLTDNQGDDYQPDVSPDGSRVAFVRYGGKSMELMLLDPASRAVRALTSDGAVSVEPRWSPTGDRLAFVSTAGSGHFLLHVASVRDGELAAPRVVTPDRRSAVTRYYYSPFDHAINPAWTRDGRDLVFVSNREIAHGTGDIVRMRLDESRDSTPRVLQHEETSWHARPDVSPDGTRIVYSSYLGRQWQQLWLLPVDGGYPFPLTYGDYDNTNPRWSPDGRTIAFISNRSGNTALWFLDVTSGQQRALQVSERRYLHPHRDLNLRIVDQEGSEIPARVSVTDSRQRSYAPDDAWVHADDMLVRERQRVETRYFHSNGRSRIAVPLDRLAIMVSHGPSFEVAHVDDDPRSASWAGDRTVTLHRLPALRDVPESWSGDLHVHMNYAGTYRNTPAHLAEQARAEDLNLVYDLIVNKEQRYPDIASFRPGPDPVSTRDLLILHGQEFHTSYWGHLGILHLTEHLLLPAYAGYPQTAASSLYPHNGAVADMAHQQHALVGYAHPFDLDVDPAKDAAVTNELPVDAALGKVDYYEAVGFSDHKASNAVWYRLLECGLKIPAGAGTDAMANYASLRGPVGMNRVYVPATGALTPDRFLEALRAGRGVATNGALLDLTAGQARPGDTVRMSASGVLDYRGTLRANFPVDHLELIWNGAVVANLRTGADRRLADVRGTLPVETSGWLLLRAWNDDPDPDLMDIYRYATTSPIYVELNDRPRRSRAAAEYFLQWIDRLESATRSNDSYRTSAERDLVLQDIARARTFYEQCRRDAR